jgi:AcrR family transcriptional regulator
MTASTRHYAGHSAAERQLQRRDRLIEAAIKVYGKHGYRNATVKFVCDAAGLTERYFYESFANSEALLIASFDAVAHAVLSCLDAIRKEHDGPPEERTRAMLRAYYKMLKDDPDGARLFVVEIASVSPAVEEALTKAVREFGELLSRTLVPETNVRLKRDQLIRAGVIGGVLHIAKNWIKGGYVQPVDAVAEDALRLCRVLEAKARV